MIGDTAAVYGLVKVRLMLKDDTLEPLLNIYIQEIGHRILHYCNMIKKIPKELNYVWSSMVIDLFRLENPNITEVAASFRRRGLVRVGDTEIDYSRDSSSKESTNMTNPAIDTVVNNYKIDLRPYRGLRWNANI